MQVSKAFVAAAVAAVVGFSSVSATAQPGPSFNCRKARTFVEKEVCRSPSLSRKDRAMSQLYFEFLSYKEDWPAEARALRDDQRRWLARRDRCQTNACLHRLYDERIDWLEMQTD